MAERTSRARVRKLRAASATVWDRSRDVRVAELCLKLNDMRAKLVEADPSLLDEPEESALLRRVDEEDKAVGVALDRLQAAFDDPKATDIDLERALQHLGIARLRCNAARIRAGVANSRIQERPQ